MPVLRRTAFWGAAEKEEEEEEEQEEGRKFPHLSNMIFKKKKLFIKCEFYFIKFLISSDLLIGRPKNDPASHKNVPIVQKKKNCICIQYNQTNNNLILFYGTPDILNHRIISKLTLKWPLCLHSSDHACHLTSPLFCSSSCLPSSILLQIQQFFVSSSSGHFSTAAVEAVADNHLQKSWLFSFNDFLLFFLFFFFFALLFLLLSFLDDNA